MCRAVGSKGINLQQCTRSREEHRYLVIEDDDDGQ